VGRSVTRRIGSELCLWERDYLFTDTRLGSSALTRTGAVETARAIAPTSSGINLSFIMSVVKLLSRTSRMFVISVQVEFRPRIFAIWRFQYLAGKVSATWVQPYRTFKIISTYAPNLIRLGEGTSAGGFARSKTS